jgi:hypothetical protein
VLILRCLQAAILKFCPVKQGSYIASNNDVGSNFEISRYLEQNHTQENLLYVNFTNFKMVTEKAFWKDEPFMQKSTLSIQRHPTVKNRRRLS